LLRYLIRLDNQGGSKTEQISNVSKDIVAVVEKFQVTLKNFRISDIAVEFDLFAKDVDSKKCAVEAFESKYGKLLSERNLNEETSHVTKPETVILVIELFNEQRYWECHEVMENVWRKEKVPAEKTLHQGVILAASALVHAQKNESNICFGMLPRTIEKLERWEKRDYYGLDVDQLKNYLKNILETRRIEFRKI
jgi:uncharacterized protein